MTSEKKSSILVVDDEPSVLITYGMILSKKGYEVETAVTSVDAIRAIDRKHFDLLLCDYSLEQEHTGFEVIDYGRKRQPKVRAAILTGYASKETADQAREDGIAILYKPIDIEEFFTTIANLLKEDYDPYQDGQEEANNQPSAGEKGNSEGSTQSRAGRRSRGGSV